MKKILSMLIAAVMVISLVPITVFAQETSSLEISGLEDRDILVGSTAEFTVTSVAAAEDEGKMVICHYEIDAEDSDIEKLEYYETAEGMEGWVNFESKLSGSFGPASGFSYMNGASSVFRVTFAKPGTYSVTLSADLVDGTGAVCSETFNVEVIDYADYATLNATIATAQECVDNEAKYVAATIADVKTALEAAKAVVDANYTEKDQSIVDNANDELVAAIDALLLLADTSDIEALVAAATTEVETDYTKATWAPFKAALDVANELLENELSENDQTDVDDAKSALEEAMNALKRVADTAALKAKVNEADALDADLFSSVTFGAMTEKLDAAKALLEQDLGYDDDQAEVDAALAELTTAVDNLKKLVAVSVSATAVASDVAAEYGKADTIVLVFGTALDCEEAAVLDAISIVDDVAFAEWVDTYKTVLKITLVDNYSLTNGAVIAFEESEAVVDVNGNVVSEMTVAVVGNLEDVSEEITANAMTATIVKGSAKPGVNADDKIVLVFNAPVKNTPAEIDVTSDASAVVMEAVKDDGVATVYVISNIDADLVDSSKLTFADIADVNLLGSFGTAVAPVVTKVLAVEKSNNALTENEELSLNDEIVIYFSKPTNGVAISSDDIENALGIADATADWSENNTLLTITLGSESVVTNGMTINLDGLGIMDEYEMIDYVALDLVLEGAFITSAAPVALKAYAVDNDGTELVYNKINDIIYKDQIVVVFDTPTNKASDISKISVVGTGYTASLGTKSELEWEDDGTKLVITLGQDAVIKNGASIDLTSLGIMDKDCIISADITTLELDIEGSFGYTIQPRITKAVAFTQNDMDYIRVFFNTEVKAKAGETIDVAISEFTMGASASKGLVDQNNGLTYYEIAMAKDEHSAFESGRYAVSLTGIVDKETGSKELASTPVTITGAFISPITPEVLKVVAISNDGSGVAKAGDKIVAVFNTEVKLGTISASEGYLGTGYSVRYSSTAKNVVEIVLGDAGLNVEPGTTEIIFSGFMDEATESVTMVDTTKVVGGSFGYSDVPEIMSATAVSANGSGVPKAGDKIVVVFNTMVTYNGEDIYYYEYTLKSDNEYDIDKIFEITVTSKATGISYDLEKVIEGTFGYSVMPDAKSVVLSESNGIETITVVFDRATNMPNFASNELNLIETNNEHLGNGISAAWISDAVLKITLAANATTTDASKLNLSGLGIKAKDTGVEITGINELAITGTLVPVVQSVNAQGKVITITFSTRTNGVANISNLVTLLGAGAKAEWSENNKVLTITLGESYTITNNGYIVLNGMGIKDGFSGTHHIVGQYRVFGSIETDTLAVTKIVAQRTDKDRSTTNAKKGDKIIVKFNSATDLNGAMINTELYAADVDEIISVNGGNEAALGTGYTGTWTAYDTLEIILGGSTTIAGEEGSEPTVTGNDPAITVGTEITVSGVAFANGEGTMNDTVLELAGSFNGREFVITDGKIERTGSSGNGDYRISMNVENTLLNTSVKPTIVCVAYNGSSAVSVTRITIDIADEATPIFELSGNLKITSAKIYVFSDAFATITSSPEVLAEPIEIK